MGDGDYTDRAVSEWRAIRPSLDLESFAVGVRVLRLATRLRSQLDESVRGFGFAVLGDYEVASCLRRARRALTPSDIAERLMLTRAGITGRLDRLEVLGYVERRKSQDDARRVLVHLLPKGRRATDRTLIAVAKLHHAEFAALTATELSTLAEMLNVVAQQTDPPRT